MADQPPTPSGSRWEPDPAAADATDAEAPHPAAPEPSVEGPAAAPYEAAAPAATAPEDDPAGAARRAQVRGRAILAGAATALTLGGGVVGFVVGHSTAGGTDLRPANFSRQFGDGQQGPPGFGDRDGDGNGRGGQLGQQQPGADGPADGTSGSSTRSSSGTST